MDKEDTHTHTHTPTHTHTYTHTMKYYLAIKKKNELMSFEATWMELEIIVLKVRNRKRNTIRFYLYVKPKP